MLIGALHAPFLEPTTLAQPLHQAVKVSAELARGHMRSKRELLAQALQGQLPSHSAIPCWCVSPISCRKTKATRNEVPIPLTNGAGKRSRSGLCAA